MAPLVGIKKAILGSAAFSIFWLTAVFPSLPILPIGRTAGSLLSSLLMILFQITTPSQSYTAIDLPILALLFATMLLSSFLQKANLFIYLRRLLSFNSPSPRNLLLRVSLISAFSSALFTNDTACILLTDFLLDLTARQNLPPLPFLLALASNANIGSSATPIGNPQNLVIAIQGKIPFGKFLIGILPAMIVGVIVNTAIILGMFWKSLKSPEVRALEEEVSPEKESSPAAVVVEVAVVVGNEERRGRKREMVLKWSVYLVTLGMLAALLAGMDMPWTVITAAVVLLVIDFRDAGPSLEKVSYSLLVFFTGMFITVDGFNRTGIPGVFWNLMEPSARVNKASGLALLSVVILLLSNVASNVPTVLLLGSQVAKSAAEISPSEVNKAWLILAWVSTVAGNFSLLGSAANLIVCEQARRSEHHRYNLSFWKHLQFGIPSTLIVTVIGLPLIRG